MFETSTPVTISIAIYPNTGDSWGVLSPFPGDTLSGDEAAFVVSTSDKCKDGSLHLLRSRLYDVDKLSNTIDFMIKTNLKQESVPESSGIGGMSKLKDFNFTILKNYLSYNNMETRDILALYGRTVVVFMSDSVCIEKIDSSEILFKGQIFSIDRQDEEIIITVRGLLNTANPFVGGAVVETSDGSQQNETIVFGDSGDIFVPISKKLVNGKYVLQWSQNAIYIIKDLYVKGGSNDEPIFSKIDTPYNIINNEIVFDTVGYTTAVLKSAMGDASYLMRDRINIKASYEISIHFDSFEPSPSPGDKAQYVEYGTGLVKYPNILIFNRTEIVDGENIFIFTCGWEFIYGYLRGRIDNPSGYVPRIVFPGVQTYTIDYVVTGENENPIEKEIDALPFTISGQDWSGNELKDYIQKRNRDGVKIFQLIPKSGFVIRIDNEEMLVVYTEKDSFEPTFEQNPSMPENTFVWVVRGWNNTELTTHSMNTPIQILNVGSVQSVIYTLKRKLQSLTTVTPSKDWYFSDLDKFLNGVEPLTVFNYSGQLGGGHDPAGFIGLDFKFPETPGNLILAYLTGEANCDFDNNQTFHSPEHDRRSCFINLALSVPDDFSITNVLSYRRAFGERVGSHDKQDRYCLTKFNIDTTKTIQGEYEFRLKTSWNLTVQEWNQAPYLNKWLQYTTARKTKDFEIKTYEDLKDVSKFIVFNSSNIWEKKTSFNMTLPTMNVNMEVALEDADIYAKIIPLTIFDNPIDTLPIGSNCKIAWHNVKSLSGNKDMLVISDDDLLCFGYYIITQATFDTYPGRHQFTVDPPFSNPVASGILVNNLGQFKDSGKLYTNINKKEWFLREGASYKIGSFVRSNFLVNGLLNVGKDIVENGNCYIWVDQANNLLKTAFKQDTDIGNPVRIIKTLLETYYTDVTLDEAMFIVAISKRVGWNARLIVKNEERLTSLVDKIAKEHGLIVFENNTGEMSIVTLDPPSEDEVIRDITDSEIIYVNKNIDYKEQFTDLDYLITNLDVYYDFINGKFKGYIKSDDISDQTSLIVAGQYSENPIKIKLQLESVFEQNTADKCALIKMLYHQIPTRIITVKTTLSTSDIEIGQWVTCSSSKIPEVSGKIYFVMGVDKQIPFKDKGIYNRLTLFEYDWDNLVLRIQEVPEQSINENYDEIPDSLDDIDEIPDI